MLIENTRISVSIAVQFLLSSDKNPFLIVILHLKLDFFNLSYLLYLH